MPPREKGEPFDHWAKIVRSMNTRTCQYSDTGIMHGNLSQRSAQRPLDINTPGDAMFQTWAGNIADEPVGGGASYEVQHSDTNSTYWYTEMDADWNIPCVAGQQVAGDSTAWVGLGGTAQADELGQAGSESDFGWDAAGDPVTAYYVWYEWVGPFGTINANRLNWNVGCGSAFHIWVKIYGGNCYVIQNLSNSGQYFSMCSGPTYDNHTAEAIIERPSRFAGMHTALDNFGWITFKGVGITENSKAYQGLPNLWHDYSTMVQNGQVLASVAPIVWDANDYPNDDFNINWVAGGTACNPCA